MNLLKGLFTRFKLEPRANEELKQKSTGAKPQQPRPHVDLNFAAASGNPDLVELALAEKPDLNAAAGPSGFTPMLSAVSGTDSEARQMIVKLLHAAGADIEKKDTEKGLTPLHYAALRNKPLITKVLLECGANVHVTEANGATALHGAVFHGNLEVCELLLKAGADPALSDKHGYTPLFLAERGGHDKILALLKVAMPSGAVNAGSQPNESYLEEVEERNKTANSPEELARILSERISALEARAVDGLIVSASMGEHFQTIVSEMENVGATRRGSKGIIGPSGEHLVVDIYDLPNGRTLLAGYKD